VHDDLDVAAERDEFRVEKRAGREVLRAERAVPEHRGKAVPLPEGSAPTF